MPHRLVVTLILALILSACVPPTPRAPTATPAPSATLTAAPPTPTQPPASSATLTAAPPTPTLTPTPPPSTSTPTRRSSPTLIPTAAPPHFEGLGSGKIVFSSQHFNPAAELSLVDLKTNRTLRLIGNLFARNLHPSLSPDGAKLAFAAYLNGNFDLYTLNVDSQTLAGFPEDLEQTLEPFDWLEKLAITRLTETEYDETHPVWSPDGKFIAYVGGPPPMSDIFILPSGGGEALQVTRNLIASAPDWSPDGKTLLFEDWSDGGGVDLAWVPAAGGARQKLTSTLGEDEEKPAWSPDGTKIAFCKTYNGQSEIAVMSADGKQLTRLTDHPARDCRPAWSPDGSRILFVSERSGAPNLFVMETNGQNVRQLTFFTRPNEDLEGVWGK